MLKCSKIEIDEVVNLLNLSEDGMKLTPYTFTVTNTCNEAIEYNVALETFGESNVMSSDSIKIMFDSNEPTLLSGYKKAAPQIKDANIIESCFGLT